MVDTSATLRGSTRFCIGALLIATLAILLPSKAMGVSVNARPAWSIYTTTYPTALVPGSTNSSNELAPTISVTATNVGGAPTSGNFTIVDQLPDGISVRPGATIASWWGSSQNKNVVDEEHCTGAGQVVTCENSAANNLANLFPGESISFSIPVEVSVTASGPLTNETTAGGGGASFPTTAHDPIAVGDGSSPFGFLPGAPGLSANATTEDGTAAEIAGSHPFQATFNLGFPANQTGISMTASGGGPKDLSVTLPRGFVVNPNAAPVQCTEEQLETEFRQGSYTQTSCPSSSQVGVVSTLLSTGTARPGPSVLPLFAMESPPGSAGTFAFEAVNGVFVHLLGRVNSEGAYELSASARDVTNQLVISRATVTLWGDPGDSSHDRVRGRCLYGEQKVCHDPAFPKPLLTLPSECSSSMQVHAGARSWGDPSASVEASVGFTDLNGNAVTTKDCGSLGFAPSISAQPTKRVSGSASGLDFELVQPQNEDLAGRATANLRDARVALPTGVSLNPSAANGLAACTEAQMGRTSADPLRFSAEPQSCPNASKVGTVEVETSLLGHSLPGAVYVAEPFDNPFDSLLAIYLAIEDEQSGVVSKLAGEVEADGRTGQLTATFEENPELPLEKIKLHFFDGNRAALKLGESCGTFETTSRLTPWSAPFGADASPSNSFVVEETPSGRPCPATEAAAPAEAKFDAGTLQVQAGSFSPFVLAVSRDDGSQQFSSIEGTLPPGLLGKLAGIPYCPESGIQKANQRSGPDDGALELADPSCPPASQVGSVDVAAGAGSTPVTVAGRAYLAGPYKGASLSLEVITPAIAGPFDLGVVAVRVPLYVEPFTAQIRAVSDSLPAIRHGIPLDIRSVTMKVDRPQFTLNPTNCDPLSISGAVGTLSGQTESLTQRFQVGGCDSLAFKPRLSLSLKGATRRAGHPALKAVVTYPKHGAYANISRAQVGLPHSAFLDQSNLDKVCTQAELRAATCPKSSIYGHVKAWTPLLDKPLEGPVYLGVGFGYELPAIVADLNGQVRILLKGKVDTTADGGIRNTFEAVPDAPVSRFVLKMKGGRNYGLLVNSENICRSPQRASIRFWAQNGRSKKMRPLIRNGCKGKGKKRDKRNP